MQVIAERVRASKAGLGNPKAPMGIFLFVGPSGVGKTETALGVADLLFGGEKFMTTINMSEFQEKHTVSRLIGSPPGYVGYGEGGVLTEAVRQRPYSVVLLDEVEKAHPEVLNLFYQVFDKGMLADGEGRVIDFKDTIIFLTSNLASDITMQMCQDGKVQPDINDISTRIRPVLNNHFKPALLARMSVVPYYPISRAVMREIVQLKLRRLEKQLATAHRMTLTITDRVYDLITARCTVAETGARNIDYIINGALLPRISTEVLSQLADGTLPDTLTIDVRHNEFTFTFSTGPVELAPYDDDDVIADPEENLVEQIAAATQTAPPAPVAPIATPDDGLSAAERAQQLAAQAQAMLAQVAGKPAVADETPPTETE
jgi:type VI secretion system protein VasG